MKIICDIYQESHASSPVDLACLRNHLLHACSYWYCGCHPQDTAVRRERTHCSISSIRAVVHGFSRNMCSTLVGLRHYSHQIFSRVLVWYVHTRRTLYKAKQGCGAVSCTTLSYGGACWREVLELTWFHTYVREDCYFGFFIEMFHFFSRYLVVGSRYDFFFGFNNMRRNTRRSDLVGYQAETWQQPCVAFRGQGGAAVRQFASMNDSYRFTIKLWIACGHTTVVSHS